MKRSEQLLYHQIHPVKLAVDLTSSAIALWLVWNHRWVLGLAVDLLPSVAISALLIATVDLRPIRDSPAGRLLRRYMTPAMTALRATGAVVGFVGALLQLWWLLGLGALVVALAWSRVYVVPALRDRLRARLPG